MQHYNRASPRSVRPQLCRGYLVIVAGTLVGGDAGVAVVVGVRGAGAAVGAATDAACVSVQHQLIVAETGGRTTVGVAALVRRQLRGRASAHCNHNHQQLSNHHHKQAACNSRLQTCDILKLVTW